MKWVVSIHLVDTAGFPAAGVEVAIVILPADPAVSVQYPPTTDVDGNTSGFISSTQEVCVTVEVRAGGVALNEKPYVCFRTGNPAQ